MIRMTLKAMLAATALAGCAFSASATQLTIGFSQIGSESGWRAIAVVPIDRDIDPSDKDLYLTAVISDSVHEGEVTGDRLAASSR